MNRALAALSRLPLRAALCGFVGCELALVVVSASGPSSLTTVPAGKFNVTIAGPFAGLAKRVFHSGSAYHVTFVVLMAVMCVCYAAIAVHAERMSLRVSLVAVSIASVAMVLGPPFRLTDAFNYIEYARLGVLHGLNPYVHTFSEVPPDQVYGFTSWRHHPTPYGPLFTALSYPLAWLGLGAALWTLKAVTVGAAVASAALVGACANRLARNPTRAVLLFGLNPIALVYGLGALHNDFLMELAFLAAIYLILEGRERAAGWAGAAAAALKLSALPLLPFLALGARRPRRALAWLLIAGAVLAGLTLLVFGHRAPGIAQTRAGASSFSLPHLIASALGHGGYRSCPGAGECATRGTEWAANAALVIGLAAAMWWTYRTRDWITGAGWGAIVLVATLTWLMPWYLLWVLPLAILSRSRALWVGAVALALFIVLPAGPGFVGSPQSGPEGLHALRPAPAVPLVARDLRWDRRRRGYAVPGD